MALITISGYPCSGKTARAQQIKAYIEERLRDPDYQSQPSKVILLSDDTLGLSRSAYNESVTEKPQRGALFTAIQRQMASDTILIVDALNYIKGFRYQLYCAAREMKLRVCTVYVLATHELCRQWNNSRPSERAYSSETLENLLVRFEEPSSMVRWDSPLFVILWEDATVPGPDVWAAIMKGNIKPPNSGTLNVAKAPSDALHTLEQTTTAIISAILMENASSQGAGGVTTLVLPESVKLKITLPSRNLSLSELQRLKRQFVTVHRKAITLGTAEKGPVDWGEEKIANKFVSYLEESL